MQSLEQAVKQLQHEVVKATKDSGSSSLDEGVCLYVFVDGSLTIEKQKNNCHDVIVHFIHLSYLTSSPGAELQKEVSEVQTLLNQRKNLLNAHLETARKNAAKYGELSDLERQFHALQVRSKCE